MTFVLSDTFYNSFLSFVDTRVGSKLDFTSAFGILKESPGLQCSVMNLCYVMNFYPG